MKISVPYAIITNQGILHKNNKKQKNNNMPFCANMLKTTVSAEIINSLFEAHRVNMISTLKRGKHMLNETEKFIDIRENFSKKLEPAIIYSEETCWDFYNNSTPETHHKFVEAENNMFALYQDKNTYNKLKSIDKTKLPEHESKQLKDLLKSFDEELNAGEQKKELRKKEADIGQKYNTYVPMIDDKEVTKVDILKIIQSETNPVTREKAYNAVIKGGDLIAKDLIELVKMRNNYAKTQGYSNYFDYMIKEEYDVEPKFLNKLIDDVYSIAQNKINIILSKREEELKNFFGVKNLKAYHYGLLLDSNPEKKVNEILKTTKVEDISKKIYFGMGYDIDKLQKDNKLTLDLYPRKGKNTHGFSFGVKAGEDSRILANLTNNLKSLDTLNHELGHCIYDLGLSKNLPFIDRHPASPATTEAIAMMMGDIMKKENVLKDIIPDEILQNLKNSLKDDEADFVSKSLQIIEFEREIYKNPDQNPAQLWSDVKRKYKNRNEAMDNEWATIPHYLTHPGYYQNYFRAALMKVQIYNHLHKQLGNITENHKTAEYMNKNIFSIGASIDEYALIKQLTGKEFSASDFIQEL